jgi:histidinol-phosphatase (PHP family)
MLRGWVGEEHPQHPLQWSGELHGAYSTHVAYICRQNGLQCARVRDNATVLPADQHVHTQWSLDAPTGSMRQACARAIELGLPAVTFTDHADLTTLVVSDDAAAYIESIGGTVTGGVYRPPPLDVAGYLSCVAECRAEFPGLPIRAGVELGDPHLHPEAAAAVAGSGFELIVGSVHSLRRAAGFADAADRYADLPDAEVVREYLAHVTTMIETSGHFDVLAHINYAARYWPGRQGDYRSADFENEYRKALRALARTGRGLEINTSGWLPLDADLLTWWWAEGGRVVSFGSDAHDPVTIGREFASAAAMAHAAGFSPASDGSGLWMRR